MLNRGPSAYQPNTLLLGQTGSRYIYILYIKCLPSMGTSQPVRVHVTFHSSVVTFCNVELIIHTILTLGEMTFPLLYVFM